MCGNIQDIWDLKMFCTVAYLASVLWLDTESLGFNTEVRSRGQFEIRLYLPKMLRNSGFVLTEGSLHQRGVLYANDIEIIMVISSRFLIVWRSIVCLNVVHVLFNNKPFHGNTRHVFDGAKLFISNIRCRLRPGARTSRTVQFCPFKNMAHIIVKGFIGVCSSNKRIASCNTANHHALMYPFIDQVWSLFLSLQNHKITRIIWEQ